MTNSDIVGLAERVKVLEAENDALREALEPFAEVAEWAERNGYDLNDFDMLLRGPQEQIAGHLAAQAADFIKARATLSGSPEG